MIFLKKEMVDFDGVEEFDDKTFRGAKDFGSTSLKETSANISY